MSKDLVRIIGQLERLQQEHIVVGVPRSNQHLTMIALVQEYGKTIRPVHGDWLVVPTENARKMHVEHASQVPGMFRPKGKNVLALKDDTAESGLKIMFVLKKETRIPARPFLRYTYDLHAQLWANYASLLVRDMMLGKLSVEQVQRHLASRMVTNLKSTIRHFSKPSNAPLTRSVKGFNDPLMDHDELINSITFFIEREF